MQQHEPFVDLTFPLRGNTIPADHGYPLYSAVSRLLPAIHGDESMGIHPIQGRLVGGRLLALTRESQLTLRLPISRVPAAISLAGKRIDLGGEQCLVGVPTTRGLRPVASLASRLVVVRGFTEAASFLDAVQRQMAALNIAGAAALPLRRRPLSVERQAGSQDSVIRRTLRIHGKEVVGFAVRVDQLTADESICLQESGLGGRRRFGCGIFVPAGRDSRP